MSLEPASRRAAGQPTGSERHLEWTVTSIDHPLWTVEELFQCNCTPEAYEYLNELLYNPEFDHMSAEDIIDEVGRFNEEQIFVGV